MYSIDKKDNSLIFSVMHLAPIHGTFHSILHVSFRHITHVYISPPDLHRLIQTLSLCFSINQIDADFVP